MVRNLIIANYNPELRGKGWNIKKIKIDSKYCTSNLCNEFYSYWQFDKFINDFLYKICNNNILASKEQVYLLFRIKIWIQFIVTNLQFVTGRLWMKKSNILIKFIENNLNCN